MIWSEFFDRVLTTDHRHCLCSVVLTCFFPPFQLRLLLKKKAMTTKPSVKKIVVSPSFTPLVQYVAEKLLFSDYALMAVGVAGAYIPARHEGISCKGLEESSKLADVAYEEVEKGRKVAVLTLDSSHLSIFYRSWSSKQWEVIKIDEGMSVSDLENAMERVRVLFFNYLNFS